ncbi:hypothetical protein Droror1_Dr00024542 [Drosera rotundifolia]
MCVKPEIEKLDPTAEIDNDQIVNKDLASVEEEQTQDKPVESTPTAEQVVVADSAFIDEQASMITETEVEKEDSNTKIAAIQEIVKDMENIEGEQAQDRPEESTPQSPVRAAVAGKTKDDDADSHMGASWRVAARATRGVSAWS